MDFNPNESSKESNVVVNKRHSSLECTLDKPPYYKNAASEKKEDKQCECLQSSADKDNANQTKKYDEFYYENYADDDHLENNNNNISSNTNTNTRYIISCVAYIFWHKRSHSGPESQKVTKPHLKKLNWNYICNIKGEVKIWFDWQNLTNTIYPVFVLHFYA